MICVLTVCGFARAQGAPEVVSPLGEKFYAQEDKENKIAEAEKKLAADPKNIELIIALGQAQAVVWRYHDAIKTYTRGLELDPNHAMLLRHRGHRYISTRQFDKAVTDLRKAAELNSKDFEIWYHLGLAYYLKGEFAKAADAYEKCLNVADKDDSRIAVSDWLYMTYRREKKKAAADKVLERITPEMKVEQNKSYFDRLLFYKGLKKEADVVNPEKMNPLEFATIGYGIGNWYLYNGNAAKAKEYFQKVVASKQWPAFGFIAAETDLARIR